MRNFSKYFGDTDNCYGAMGYEFITKNFIIRAGKFINQKGLSKKGRFFHFTHTINKIWQVRLGNFAIAAKERL